VSDRGIGIPAEHLGRVFDRFHQERSSSRRGGMGLGLFISRQIVELHGGRIWAENRSGGGTRLSLRLPLGPPAPGPEEGR
jgi:signal transduction histidine kinase